MRAVSFEPFKLNWNHVEIQRPTILLMRGLLIAVTLLLSTWTRPAAAEDVALTFDDVPTLSLTTSLAYAQTTTKILLRGLRRHRPPATGFVSEIQLDGHDREQRIALLADWLDAGMDLGNHGYSHVSLTTTPVDVYIADVIKGEAVTRALLASRGRKLHWFRHPNLETGPTLEIRRTFEDWLGAHGYRVAPVTMENSDWVFALPYDGAILRGDKAEAARIKRAYLAYTAQIVPWYRGAALQIVGRPLAFVFLLHASRLNADSMDQLAAVLRNNHLHAVSLDHAMKDPAYGISDTYAGPDGIEWLERWSMTLHRDMPWPSLPQPPPDIVAENQRLDSSP